MSDFNMFSELNPWDCGQKYFNSGFNIIDNPFDKETKNGDWQAWIDGFNSARAKSAHQEGYRAYQADVSINDNPYASDQFEWEHWKEGWYDSGWDS